jgi:hypothetical protein
MTPLNLGILASPLYTFVAAKLGKAIFHYVNPKN